MNRETDLRVHAVWWTRPKRRWPLDGLLATGVVVGLFAFASGYGRMLALKRLPESRAEFLALEPPPLSGERNAAPLWDRADMVALRWPGKYESSPDYYEFDWSNPLHYVGSSPLRAYLSSNAGALELARQAAALPDADWKGNYQLGFAMTLPHLAKLRKLARLLTQDAVVRAADGDWKSSLDNFHAAFVAARHVGSDPMVNLVAVAIEGIALDRLHQTLIQKRSPLTLETLGEIETLLLKNLRQPSGVTETVNLYTRMCTWTMDQVAAGNENKALGVSDLSAMGYRLIYPYDRWKFQAVMQRVKEAVRRSESGEPGESVQVWDGHASDFSSVLDEQTIGRILVASMEGVARTETKRTMRFRLVLAEIAVLKFRLTHGGAWPDSLESTGLSIELRTDPWSAKGKELEYTHNMDTGATIRSGRHEDYFYKFEPEYQRKLPPEAGAVMISKVSP